MNQTFALLVLHAAVSSASLTSWFWDVKKSSETTSTTTITPGTIFVSSNDDTGEPINEWVSLDKTENSSPSNVDTVVVGSSRPGSVDNTAFWYGDDTRKSGGKSIGSSSSDDSDFSIAGVPNSPKEVIQTVSANSPKEVIQTVSVPISFIGSSFPFRRGIGGFRHADFPILKRNVPEIAPKDQSEIEEID